MEKIINFIKARSKERSTWGGVIILTMIGLTKLYPDSTKFILENIAEAVALFYLFVSDREAAKCECKCVSKNSEIKCHQKKSDVKLSRKPVLRIK